MRRRAYYADAVIDLALEGWVVTVAAERRNRGRLMVFPAPVLVDSASGVEPIVRLASSRWLVHDAIASTLPLSCSSQDAARSLADAFAADFARETVDAGHADQVGHWCRWWLHHHPDDAAWVEIPAMRVHNHPDHVAYPATDPDDDGDQVAGADPASVTTHVLRHAAGPMTVTEVP